MPQEKKKMQKMAKIPTSKEYRPKKGAEDFTNG